MRKFEANESLDTVLEWFKETVRESENLINPSVEIHYKEYDIYYDKLFGYTIIRHGEVQHFSDYFRFEAMIRELDRQDKIKSILRNTITNIIITILIIIFLIIISLLLSPIKTNIY